MAIQSAAIIQGGPTSSSQQVVFLFHHAFTLQTNVSCVSAVMLGFTYSLARGETGDFMKSIALIANENEASE